MCFTWNYKKLAALYYFSNGFNTLLNFFYRADSKQTYNSASLA